MKNKKSYIILDSKNKNFSHYLIGTKKAEIKLREYQDHFKTKSRFYVLSYSDYKFLKGGK